MVSGKIVAARLAQVQWRRYSLTQRVAALRAWWSALESERGLLTSVVREDTGRSAEETQVLELEAAGLALKFFTRNAHRLLQDQAVGRPWVFLNKRAYVRHLPRGVVGIVSSRSLPFLGPFADAVPALLAGNAVVLKAPEAAPKTALYLEDRFKISGLFPEGLLQTVAAGAQAAEALAREADMILFTGPAAEGRKLAMAAAERMIPAVLELGGRHAMLVAKDASLERASRAAAWGRSTAAVGKVFVEEAVYQPFAEALAKEPAAPARLDAPGELEAFEQVLEDARAKGGQVEGGAVLDRERLAVSPALILGAKPDMRAMREEAPGPILPVMAVGRIEEALRLANESPYGLSASVWTRDLARGERLSALLEDGAVGVNDLGGHRLLCSLPSGGFKESGLGRRRGDEGLRMFCRPQAVLVHEWPSDSPELWWLPYTRFKSRLLSILAKLA